MILSLSVSVCTLCMRVCECVYTCYSYLTCRYCCCCWCCFYHAYYCWVFVSTSRGFIIVEIAGSSHGT